MLIKSDQQAGRGGEAEMPQETFIILLNEACGSALFMSLFFQKLCTKKTLKHTHKHMHTLIISDNEQKHLQLA